jgi:hypothetical protein
MVARLQHAGDELFKKLDWTVNIAVRDRKGPHDRYSSPDGVTLIIRWRNSSPSHENRYHLWWELNAEVDSYLTLLMRLAQWYGIVSQYELESD